MLRRPLPAWLIWVALAAVLLLAAYLRLANVAVTPGWYTDEGTHLSIAQNLREGRVQYMALNQSTLLVARLPLFELLLSAAGSFGGVHMSTLRHLTALLGVLTTGLLFLVVRLSAPKRPLLAVLAALMFAIYPQAVILNRFGFSYNLLMPLVLLLLLGIVKYWGTKSWRWLALAAFSVGLGVTSDVIMGAFAVALLLVVILRQPRHLLIALLLIVAPFGLYVLAMLLTAPEAFVFDLQYTLTRLGGRSLSDQVNGLALNFTRLLAQDFWLLAALVGLFAFSDARRLRLATLLLLLLPIAIIGRSNALYDLSAYYFVPFLPLVALGAGLFLYGAATLVWRVFRDELRKLLRLRPQTLNLLAGTLTALLIAAPLRTTLLLTVAQVNSEIPTAIDPILLNPADVEDVAAAVNAVLEPEDMVIASPGLTWLIEGNTADFQMALAAADQGTVHFPEDVPPDRWQYDPRYENARFVIVDNLWRNWAALNIPPLLPMLNDVEANWDLIYESGQILVYENPTA